MPTKKLTPGRMNLSDLAARLGKNKSTLSRHCERLKLGTRTKRGIELTDAEVTQLAAAVALARPGSPSLTRPKQ